MGLLCCIYLASLKLINVPCPLAGCGEIINSHYGAVFGIPLPMFAVPLWIILTLPTTGAWQARSQLVCVLLLALGGLALMGIQFLVLRGFCAFCTLHAAAAVAAAFALPFKGRAHAWLPALMLGLTLPIILGVKESAEARVRSWESPPSPTAGGSASPGSASAPARTTLPANIDQAAFRWLGEIDAKRSPILVVSFQCSHCLDLLDQTLKSAGFGPSKGPKVFVYAQPHDSADSIAVLAAILSVPGTPQEKFAAVFSQLDALREPLLEHDSKELRKRLGTLFPDYAGKLDLARQQFNVQVVALKYIQGKGSPFLLQPDGSSTYGVKSSDLLLP